MHAAVVGVVVVGDVIVIVGGGVVVACVNGKWHCSSVIERIKHERRGS